MAAMATKLSVGLNLHVTLNATCTMWGCNCKLSSLLFICFQVGEWWLVLLYWGEENSVRWFSWKRSCCWSRMYLFHVDFYL